MVFFDLVGTLIRGTRPIGRQYAEQARRFGAAEADPDRLGVAFRAAMSAAPPMVFPGRSLEETAGLERGWWADVVGEVVRRSGLEDVLRGDTFDRFFDSLFEHFTTADAWELFPDVRPALEGLRAAGTTLGLITNYDTRVYRVLDALGLAPLLSTVVIPADVGAAKPARAIFQHALERVGAAPSQALHVGDELDDDYRGAESVGMRAVLIDRDGKCRAMDGVKRIESLAELANLHSVSAG